MCHDNYEVLRLLRRNFKAHSTSKTWVIFRTSMHQRYLSIFLLPMFVTDVTLREQYTLRATATGNYRRLAAASDGREAEPTIRFANESL